MSVRPIASGRTTGVLPTHVVRREFRTTSIYVAVHYFAARHVGIKSAGIILEINHEGLSDCSLRSVVGRLKLAIIRGHPVTRHARAIMGVAGDLAEGLLDYIHADAELIRESLEMAETASVTLIGTP